MRGVIGALAMSGLRTFARDLGQVEKTPPEEIADKPAEGLFEHVPADYRKTAVGVLHLLVGAAGGVAYGAVPDPIRQKAWSGPIWGVTIWVSYEFGAAPLLGLKHARDIDKSEQATIIVDHLLYGFILSETRGGRTTDGARDLTPLPAARRRRRAGRRLPPLRVPAGRRAGARAGSS